MSITRRWLKANLNYCAMFGILDPSVNFLMDDSCTDDEECNPVIWMTNLYNFVLSTNLPFRLTYVEERKNASDAFDEDLNFKGCHFEHVKVKLILCLD